MTEDARAAVAAVERWYHRIEVAPGVVTPGEHDSPAVLGALPFPADCTGMRVLDIGARDGFFSFEAERRGAERVIAIDSFPETGLETARRLLGSQVELVTGNVYDLSPERHGSFDLVLFLGVLYHLRNPMLALDRIRSVSSGTLVFETQVAVGDEPRGGLLRRRGSGEPGPQARFIPGDDLRGDATNWWVPNVPCLRAMLEAACFDVERLEVISPERAAGSASVSDDPQRRYLQRLDYSPDARLARR